jgi:hypothetical protein
MNTSGCIALGAGINCRFVIDCLCLFLSGLDFERLTTPRSLTASHKKPLGSFPGPFSFVDWCAVESHPGVSVLVRHQV